MKIRRTNSHPLVSAVLDTVLGRSVRGAWSQPISSRAQTKLSPYMARPNLFSGD